MSLADIRNKPKVRAPICILYGPSGVGKTSFVANIDKSIIVQTEDGIGKIESDHFPVAKSWDEFMKNLESLRDEEHSYKCVGIDSLDWLEPLVWQKACDDNGWKSIDSVGFGKGYSESLKYWRQYTDLINELRNKGMVIVQVAHNQIQKVEDPRIEHYDRHTIKLHRKATDLLVEHADAVFFGAFKLGQVQVKGKGGGMTTKAVSGDRVVYTQDSVAYLAKNRYGLPEELPMEWSAIREEMLK